MRKSRVVKLLVLCGLAAIVAHQWPEIHRYLKISRM
ncbi:hypothetical protein SAMN05421874_106280 [Nonomuraea maritima]|uniref:Uncharacterized protein n=1 Tax=Nonomuraea maritima TaxID=683260 RepID=A0A1G9AQ35_9ACTN|nr:hypothetical protein SAMN05421874_106280 [Nonomuraea maritima]